ncbi:hypothetical protein [Winogradskyella thalassocola]|uniref:Uncharacterized protein n=1 Tax=Winogradskyella thalassocola TaxID=262004 RepID=A0A1G8E5K0_9FLAO|nr:hypothetical protein [Winogradskyella thalassocola]SDH65226.1 hypothetical protein SAMN04489796_103394 [Winogradskyella thalassocola]
MKTSYIIAFIFCIFCSTTVFAQVIKDKETKSIRIPAVESKTKKDSALVKVKVAPILKKEDEKSSGNSKNNEEKFVIRETEKPFSMTENDGLKSPGEIYEKRWNKEAVKGGIVRTMSDQFLGEFKIDAEFVNIICRDFGAEDGDKVSIFLNGDLMYDNLLLTNNYRRVNIDLVDGKNTIEIKALNEGEVAPNTGEFLIHDDSGNLVSSKQWNLYKGVKAIIIFYNQKIVIKPKDVIEVEEKDEKTTSNN